ncbi:MAG: hypothetical protein NVS9B4_09360 [Candidatus Acidiferrum sp.]
MLVSKIYKMAAGISIGLLLLLISVTPAHAQLAGANLSGVVSDESGAAVAGAKVSIKNLANGSVREVSTNADGLYSAPNLAPAAYEVTVTATGFGSVTQKGLTLTVGSQQALDFKLKVGQFTQEVQVDAAATTVETSTSAVSATVEQRTVVELPLNGRDWTQLATLQPGIISVRAQASNASTANRGNRGFGNQLSDSGHRPNENTYRIDGININDYSNGSPGSVLGASLGVDAIQEFNVVTTNYTAEYGRTSGAVLNAITKSGTNDVHGSAYLFDRDKIFDAKPFFSQVKGPFRRVQFGGSAGAPIVKDKTFIFGDYEGVRQTKSQSATVRVPSPNARLGVFANGDVVTPDPNISKLLALYPLPANAVQAPDTADVFTYGTAGAQTIVEDYFTIRADHKISDKDSLNGSYFFDKAPQSLPDALNNVIHQVFTKRQMIGVTESHIFSPALANIARIGFNRVVGLVNEPVKAINPAAADPALGVSAGLFAPLVRVNGLTNVGGLGNLSFFGHHYNSYQAYDDVFLTRGKHSMKFGFAYERMQYNVLSKLNRNGRFGRYGSIEKFITNQPVTVALLDPSVQKEVGSRDSLFAGYVQDDWRVRSNLTVNIGLRYEMLTLPTEAHDGFGVLNQLNAPAVVGGCLVDIQPNNTPGCTVPVHNMWRTNPTTHDFAPRVGFSWDPFKDGKTAVRAGIGMFDILPLPYVYTIGDSLSLPFGKQLSGAGTYHSNFDPATLGNTALTRYVDQNPKRAYALNWNLNIQRELTSHIAAMIGYVGSHSVHDAFTEDDANQVNPNSAVPVRLINGVLTWPVCMAGTGPGTGTDCKSGAPTGDPNVGAIRPIFFDGSSLYHGLQSQLQVKGLHGFQGQVSFSWSRCRDDGSGAQLGDPFLNSVPSLIYFDRQNRRGPCDFDIRRNLSVNTLYAIAGPKTNSALKYVAGGWQVGAIVTASTGVPFTAVTPNDDLGQNSNDPWSFPNRLPGCNPYNSNYKTNGFVYLNNNCFTYLTNTVNGPILGNNGRNSLIGPGLVNVDFTLIKDTHITERIRLQFRAEFFNVLNHPNFQAPNIDAGTSTVLGGPSTVCPPACNNSATISQTTTEGRDIQFGLKLIF